MGNPAKYGSHDRAERGKEAGKVEKEAWGCCLLQRGVPLTSARFFYQPTPNLLRK